MRNHQTLRRRPLPVCVLRVSFLVLGGPTTQAGNQTVASDPAIIRQGEYLARAGDCVVCHTLPDGRQFAGGRPIPPPFGTLYSSNITPDPETGIGKWIADQFYSMMHTGRSSDAGLIYPAMPSATHTKVTHKDSNAICAYLRSVPPVRPADWPHELRFRYNNRSLILGWRTLCSQEREYRPDASKSDEWNRGAYLVQGLGHCSMCHSPRELLGRPPESVIRNRRKPVAVPDQSQHERLPLSQEVGAALLLYLRRSRPPLPAPEVFTSVVVPLRPLTRAAVTHIVRAALRRAGIKAPINGAHVLRHSAATAMLRYGASLAGIGAVLRHRSPRATAHYAKVDFDLLSEIAHPWPAVPSC